MSRAISRVVPLALAVVAALVLTGLGVYAARMEREVARRNVAGAAEAAARRLARSLETLAAEFASGLPAPNDPIEAARVPDVVRHLFPLRVVGVDGRAFASPSSSDGTAPANPATAESFVRDALDAAERLGDDAAGVEAQREFLRAAATAAPEATARVALLVAADAADDTLFAADADSPGDDRLEALASGAVIADPDRVLGAAARLATPESAATIRAVWISWAAIRDAAREVAKTGGTVVRLVEREDGLGMLVAAPITIANPGGSASGGSGAQGGTLDSTTRALLVGDVPSGTLRARVVDEAETLVHEAQVRRISLEGPSAYAVVEAMTPGWDAGADGTSTILRTSLAPAFRDWSVEAVAVQDAALGGVGDLTLAASIVAGIAVLVGVVALLRAADRQARLAAERQTFLDHVAHEVRTPAGALLALSEELAAGHVPPERRAKYHEHLVNESRRLARLVEDTLDLSRLDAGKLVLDLAPRDLREIVAEGIEAAAATGRVVFRAPTEPVVVRADAAALRRVVRNLVDNALRHGAAEPKPEVTVSAGDGGGRVVVVDHGPGIPADELPRLFERFRRKPSETHETKGVGVGLAISREIVRAHGGDIAVAPVTSGGAVFAVCLPRDGASTP